MTALTLTLIGRDRPILYVDYPIHENIGDLLINTGTEFTIARAANAMGNVKDTPADLAALSVLLRQIRTLVKTSSAI